MWNSGINQEQTLPAFQSKPTSLVFLQSEISFSGGGCHIHNNPCLGRNRVLVQRTWVVSMEIQDLMMGGDTLFCTMCMAKSSKSPISTFHPLDLSPLEAMVTLCGEQSLFFQFYRFWASSLFYHNMMMFALLALWFFYVVRVQRNLKLGFIIVPFSNFYSQVEVGVFDASFAVTLFIYNYDFLLWFDYWWSEE